MGLFPESEWVQSPKLVSKGSNSNTQVFPGPESSHSDIMSELSAVTDSLSVKNEFR